MRILGYVDKVGSPVKRNIALPLAKQEPLILTPNPNDQAPKDLYKRIKELERDLRRKNAALAETAALLVLSKKLEAIFQKGEDE